jgi:uncharacterized Zn finger protein (UPF0148 family)
MEAARGDAMKTRDCARCGSGYYDDGFTLCPTCDRENTARIPGALRDAPARVMATRLRYQAVLAAQAAKEAAS